MSAMLEWLAGPTLDDVASQLEEEKRPATLPALLRRTLMDLTTCHELNHAPGGLYEEMRCVAPELGHRLYELTALHWHILSLCQNMIDAMETRPPSRWALTAKDSLASMIREHDASERRLLHEAYLRDVGGNG